MRGAAFQAAMPAFERACLVSPGMTRRLKACSTLILVATLTAHAAEPGYVDPATCRPCHSRMVESYGQTGIDRKSTRLNSSHLVISYAVFCLKKKKKHAKEWSGLQLQCTYRMT